MHSVFNTLIESTLMLHFFQHLLDFEPVALTPSNLIQPLFSRWYNPGEKCEYNDGILGHLIENCRNFKYHI